ncbi:hypothetical protein P8891_05765 [Bacillus atrophaeus]|uniref:hypothetical protein n=1 Tax=Bacillus atrophaeus TaxID=1452 RepID=UPI00227E5864|nr:hypothetical protein [Bacillus atrophaeus]MCY7947938.1 hypothetical protein [Bacillus atrophaeus]MCY8098263.1 hypothetical protein [Bacillus atrophaeus]MCY9170040.1 hypothetical protein [Bacillus atrophaeus]MEC0740594.1 hypothetical protein [Bacillus atrophaeus]MEC0746970.1 hypothetical protein [Bacillus atrophaeus]
MIEIKMFLIHDCLFLYESDAIKSMDGKDTVLPASVKTDEETAEWIRCEKIISTDNLCGVEITI